MSTFLVIGLYADNGQRFAQDIEADSADAAEELIQDELDAELTIAAVMLISDGDLDAHERGDPARMRLVQ